MNENMLYSAPVVEQHGLTDEQIEAVWNGLGYRTKFTAYLREFARAIVASQSSEAQCKSCGGNNGDVPCAYPGEHERQPHCLRYSQPSEALDAEQDGDKLPDLARTHQGQKLYSLAYSRGRKRGYQDAIAAPSTDSAAARDAELMRLRAVASEYDDCIRHMDAGGDWLAFHAVRAALASQKERGES